MSEHADLRERPRLSDWRSLGFAAVHGGLIVAAVALWEIGSWPATVVIWLALAWLDHAALTRLHEAAHAMLSRSRLRNEIMGITIGTASFIPLSVYRYVHAQHHAHLGDPDDPEFWPYNLPGSPRWLRLAYAWTELTVGWIFTPLLYSVRTAQSWRNIPGHQRRRLLMEWALMAVLWVGVPLWAILGGWLEWLLVGHVAHAWMAGTLQTLRKFVEHLGMHGGSILAMTRTVVYQRAAGKAASRSQLHVDHHATHHRWARIPFYKLPEATDRLYGAGEDGVVFPSHLAAGLDMLPHLLDPKVGPQWVAAREPL